MLGLRNNQLNIARSSRIERTRFERNGYVVASSRYERITFINEDKDRDEKNSKLTKHPKYVFDIPY